MVWHCRIRRVAIRWTAGCNFYRRQQPGSPGQRPGDPGQPETRGADPIKAVHFAAKNEHRLKRKVAGWSQQAMGAIILGS